MPHNTVSFLQAMSVKGLIFFIEGWAVQYVGVMCSAVPTYMTQNVSKL